MPQGIAVSPAESRDLRSSAPAALSSSTEGTGALAAAALRLPSVSAAPPVSVSTAAGNNNQTATSVLDALDYGSSSDDEEDE